jgi:WD40 repeat protein
LLVMALSGCAVGNSETSPSARLNVLGSAIGIDMTWSPNGQILALYDGVSGKAVLVNPAGSKIADLPPAASTTQPGGAVSKHVMWSPNGRMVGIVSYDDSSIAIWDNQGHPIRTFHLTFDTMGLTRFDGQKR